MKDQNEQTGTRMNGAWIDVTSKGWRIHNECILMEIDRVPDGGLELVSLTAGEREWAAGKGEMGPALGTRTGADPVGQKVAGYRFAEGTSASLPGGGAELVLSFLDQTSGAYCELAIRCFPGRAAIELAARLANRGDAPLPLVYGLWPLSLLLGTEGTRFNVHSADPKGRHGLFASGTIDDKREFDNWIVLEDAAACESMMVGGDMGAGVLQFSITVDPGPRGVHVRAGANPPPAREGDEPSAVDLTPGATVETPIAFLALAQGGPEEVANEAFRYLKQHVMPKPISGSPFAACCVWLTLPNSEELLREELVTARRVGFDVFYHDASWVEGSSLVPGMNDWALGLGTFVESEVKFPHGLEDLSRRVRDAGMKFGLWVDPGNVDSRHIASGEIPQSWLALRKGKPLESRHPSLSPMTQLCLGNLEVVTWVKEKLAGIIDRYSLDWVKWDPSGTVNHACDRDDHGHGAHGGAWAAYAGKMEIWSHLLARFPNLSGFECEPSLRNCRTNPGPRSLLPGGYICEFMTGPMVGPKVWGSLATVKTIDSSEVRELTDSWCSASTLDYSLRQHFAQGIAFGNINGMWSQLLSKAPAGYIEAFRRNLFHFKTYRHLLFCDVWHPSLSNPDGWTAVQYTNENASESVLFAFRHPGGAQKNVVKLKALDPARTYVLTSLNDSPGRERPATGAALAGEGIALTLPNPWLAKGDGFSGPEYDSQLEFGSDIILLREQNGGL